METAGDNTFSMVIAIKPKSWQSKGKFDRYKDDIAALAKSTRKTMFGEVDLYARITWLRRFGSDEGDLDNIAKPILDALNKIVYEDDIRVCHIVLSRFDMDSLLFAREQERIARLRRGDFLNWTTGFEPHCLYIEVGPYAGSSFAGGRDEKV